MRFSLFLLLFLISSSSFATRYYFGAGVLSPNSPLPVCQSACGSHVSPCGWSTSTYKNPGAVSIYGERICQVSLTPLSPANASPVQWQGSYVSYVECPADKGVQLSGSNYVCVTCPAGQVVNPGTGACQAPCLTESEPSSGFSTPAVSFGGDHETCQNGCVVNYFTWHTVDLQGFDRYNQVHYSTGQMCSSGVPIPDAPLSPVCTAPSVVRADGTCGTPDPICKPWEMMQNHSCVNKPCPPDKILKCGTVQGAQECLCSRNYDCEPGTKLDALGNCVPPVDCPAGQSRNPITLQCGSPPDPSCPEGKHREGLTCVSDPTQPGQPDPPKSGPGSGDIDGDGQSNSNDDDSDGDGKKNGSDSDADNDGIPNSSDKTPLGPGSESAKSPTGDFDGDGIPNHLDIDRDGDGQPNTTDTEPDGPGSKPDTDPDADNNNDGVPNKNESTGDLDGDGVPNWMDSDRDGDGTPNAQDESPDGPGSGTDPKKYDASSDLDGDGIPNGNDNDIDGDGIPNASDPTPSGPGSKPGADTDLDGDGIPNGRDGDIDGDGVPNGEDKYPYGGGTGDGNGDGNSDPSKKSSGKPASLEGLSLYESKNKTFSEVWDSFTATVQSAPIALAGASFFSVSSISGSCETYNATIPFVDASVTFSAQCSSEVAEGLRIAGIIVLIIAAWVAFRIALL